ncbi:ABC1 family protein MCP2-like [Hondaea fermentalgiana]|uniref:ABC1 family protein MCP2-like n=1 Tax=Hondaea fermentalgiana TaxID=2315210 RepID=A0A2R5GPD9_9STRA|nr:ABC1 family protein MCP2-like [Hondaea fermentalgiana]|eukprot:GBG32169.1 ABC1 family protein MCP2-like [Hondaea fermentalgiana]
MLRALTSTAVGVSGLGVAYVGATDADAREAVRVASQGSDGLVRFGRTCFNAFVTAVDWKVTMYGKDKDIDKDAYKEALHAFSLRAAARLYKVCNRNGGLYTKYGQGVASMNHVLPQEITDTLAPLQDRAKSMSSEMARETVAAELGPLALEDVFASFDPEPIASASLAQVHRAVLRETGETVAVKVQYPYLREQTRGDLATLRMLTDFVGYWFPDFSYSWLTPAFADNMTLELDFIQEGRNSERLGQMFANRADVYVPKIIWKHSSRRMLIMEYVEGVKISKVDEFAAQGIHPLEVATTVSSLFGDMIHVHGFVHCDPHPGNLFVRKAPERSVWSNFGFVSTVSLLVAGASTLYAAPLIGPAAPLAALALTSAGGLSSLVAAYKAQRVKTFGGKQGVPYQVVVLDHGMYRRLDPSFRKNYCMLWKALLLRDANLGRTAAMNLGVSKDAYDRAKLKDKYKDVNAGDINKFLESLPRDLLFVMRSTNIVRGINLALGGTSRLRFRIMGESAVRGLLYPTKSVSMRKVASLASNEIIPYGANTLAGALEENLSLQNLK